MWERRWREVLSGGGWNRDGVRERARRYIKSPLFPISRGISIEAREEASPPTEPRTGINEEWHRITSDQKIRGKYKKHIPIAYPVSPFSRFYSLYTKPEQVACLSV